ncbi:hypothetical protein Ciccas_008983 [Cichlidogyrus casuarinus]|uniref:Integrase catalytic domain-containing protein n=1 Tax=Cichlidogyrus casuarinus TaxID=1844966 RepID=A0ABD2Q2R1_9PLAT
MTCHWIDSDNFTRDNILLAFAQYECSLTAAIVGDWMSNILKKFGLRNKCRRITTDGGTNFLSNEAENEEDDEDHDMEQQLEFLSTSAKPLRMKSLFIFYL